MALSGYALLPSALLGKLRDDFVSEAHAADKLLHGSCGQQDAHVAN